MECRECSHSRFLVLMGARTWGVRGLLKKCLKFKLDSGWHTQSHPGFGGASVKLINTGLDEDYPQALEDSRLSVPPGNQFQDFFPSPVRGHAFSNEDQEPRTGRYATLRRPILIQIQKVFDAFSVFAGFDF
jgi:hypothetical protein